MFDTWIARLIIDMLNRYCPSEDYNPDERID